MLKLSRCLSSLAIVVLMLTPLLSSAESKPDLYPFDNVQQHKQFQQLLHQFRCLVCQNQDLADSNAKLALDLRRQIYDRVRLEQSDDDIKSYLTERYGDFVLYQPLFNRHTALLWMSPAVLMVLASLAVVGVCLSRRLRQ